MIARRRAAGERALRFPADAHRRARQGNRRADVRARAHRRGDDADRRRPRDHRERAQLDLVPALAEPPSRSPAARRNRRGGREARPGTRSMEALAYTQNVVDEALRLYPPGWLLSRRTIEADVLGGFEVPAGTNVLLPLYLLHRHPQYWNDPDAFRPERFDRTTRASARASPTCRSPPVRGTASARPSPCTRCTCTYISWRAATGCATCRTNRSSSRRRSTCAPATRCR